jgi:hypothetical protein
MPISPLQLYMMQIVGEIENQLTITKFWFKGNSASPASTIAIEMSNIHSHFKSTVLPKYQAFCSSRWHGNHLMLINLTTEPKQMIDDVIAVSGFQDAISLPSFAAGVLSLRSGFANRNRNGRIFLPSPSTGDGDGSRLTGASFGLLQAFGSQLLTSFGTSGVNAYGRIGIFSRQLGVTRVLAPTPHLVYSTNGWTQCTQVIARSEIKTQRRRMLAHGQ